MQTDAVQSKSDSVHYKTQTHWPVAVIEWSIGPLAPNRHNVLPTVGVKVVTFHIWHPQTAEHSPHLLPRAFQTVLL